MLMTEWKKAKWLGLDRRRYPRDQVSWQTDVQARGFSASARILDISPMGFSAACSREFAEADPIRVTLPIVGQVQADIVWGLAGHFGACFPSPFEATLYARMLSAVRREGGTISR